MSAEMFHIKSDSPVVDELMFWSVAGHEGLSRASAYELEVLSKNPDVQAKDVLGRAFDVVIDFVDEGGGEHKRHCQGHAVRIVRLGRVGRFHAYRITLRSWFWLLTKRRNSRILQEMPVLEVLDAVFEDSPIKRFKKVKPDCVVGTHNPHRYCVQFDESDHDFISRLLEEEGIYYWFDAHDAPGTMHLSDASGIAHEKLPVEGTLRYQGAGVGESRFNEITRWVAARNFDTGKYASRDSDFKAIRKKLGADINSADDHELADFESFDFSGDYFDTESAEEVTKIRGDELTARRDRHWAVTGWPDVAAGRSFVFEGDPDGARNGEYVIAACTFFVSHPGYEGTAGGDLDCVPAQRLRALAADDAVNAQSEGMLGEVLDSVPALRKRGRGVRAFLLTALPVEMPFRPPRLTQRITMPGPQSAIVVGPAGEELHVDKHGRVKVHFHWDRYDESNEKSTCWVRVSQPWAGKGWGGYFIPRIGQEVIVDFLNGDPDRPIIVGRVYNDDQPIPYKSATQSGLKTRSTPGGGVNNYNEIMFEDKIGEESLSIHAERDLSMSVERDQSGSVGRDQSLKVDRDQTTSVQRDRIVNVMNNETKSVKAAQKLTVGTNQDNHVVGNQTTNVDGAHALVVKGPHRIETKSGRTDFTGGSESRTVNGSQTVTVKGNMSQKAAKMTFEAGHIEFKVTGANSMKMDGGVAPYTAAFHQYSLLSNTHINLLAVGDINQTSLGSNTTVLGPNTSGYIGNNSEANLGVARSTFLGASMDNAVGLAVSNFLGMQIENTIALKLETVAAVGIERKLGKLSEAPIHIFKAGGGGGGGGPGTKMNALGGILSAVGAVSGIYFGAKDVATTFEQYENAAQQLEDAANDPAASQIPGLQARLRAMAKLARERRDQGAALAGSHYGTDSAIGAGAGAAVVGSVLSVLGPVGTVAGGVVGGVAGGVVGGPIGAIARAAGSDADSNAGALKPNQDGSVPATPGEGAPQSPAGEPAAPGTDTGPPEANSTPASNADAGSSEANSTPAANPDEPNASFGPAEPPLDE